MGDKPRKLAPYLVFAGDMRAVARSELVAAGNPKPTMGEIAKTVGEKWKQLDDDEKQAYKDKAEASNAVAVQLHAERVEAEGGEEGGDGDGDGGDDGDGTNVSLPLARVKRIMRLDKEVKHTSVDACKVITRAAELFLENLVEGSFACMKTSKRKTIKYTDLMHHVLRKPRLNFMHDHVWSMSPKEAEKKDKENKGADTNGEGGGKPTPDAPVGLKQMTDFFTKAAGGGSKSTEDEGEEVEEEGEEQDGRDGDEEEKNGGVNVGGYTMSKQSEENDENAGGELEEEGGIAEQALVAPTAAEPLTLMEV